MQGIYGKKVRRRIFRAAVCVLFMMVIAGSPFEGAYTAPVPDHSFTYEQDQNPQIFTDTEQVYFGDDHWYYTSPDLSVFITKVYYEDCECRCFIAHIYTKSSYSHNFEIGLASQKAKVDETRVLPTKITRKFGAVYAQNGDYFWEEHNTQSGIVIRNGVVYKEKLVDSMMAFYPDGEMKVYREGDDITAADLLAAGVTDTMSFGPILVENGQICEGIMDHPLAYRNPRSAIGMVEPGHYVGILVDGRQDTSVGMEFDRLAQEFINQGCTVAYNLDGGQSTAMIFMGVQLNTHKYDRHWNTQRKVPEMYMIGTSAIKMYEISEDYEYWADVYRNLTGFQDRLRVQ